MDEMVLNALAQTIEEFSAVDEKRVYLIGVSMGGYGVWHIAARYPKKFAALVSICGGNSIPTGDRFDALARQIGKTRRELFHGADDKVVPVSESRQIVKAIEANGGNVKYNEYKNVGHNVWFNVLGEKDLLPWLLGQHRE
ncbi:MAG: alpha/beta fold hydrolase [Pyrinomonadaceae bacterium]